MLPDLFSTCGPQEKRVFCALQKFGPVSKSQLLALTGLKLTTLSRFLRPLEELRLVVRPQFGESSGGRKPALYDVTDRDYYLLGVDISRTYMQIVLTDLKLRVRASRCFHMDGQSTPERTVRTIVETARELADQATTPGGRIVLAGVGAVGPMSRTDGVLLSPRYFQASGWKDVPLVSMLRQGLGCPVSLDNGANTAVLAEALYGIGRGVPRVVYVNCGVGIRTGTFLDGVLIRTSQNAEDVFGHMVVNADGRLCTCGKRGCLDCYATIRAVTSEFAECRARGEHSDLPADVTWESICAAARQGDALAASVLRHAATYLGIGLSNLINLLGPGLVILSGPLIRQSNLFYETAAGVAQKQVWAVQSGVKFHRGGSLEEDAIAVGGAALALEEAAEALPDSRVQAVQHSG